MFESHEGLSENADRTIIAPAISPKNNPSLKFGNHTAFANSHLWQMQRDYYQQKGLAAWSQAQVPHYITNNPSMAKAYAEIVLGFWRDLKAQYKTINQPLYIIELGAGSGRFAYHFLLHFFEAFDAIREPDDKVCYVMTDFAASTVAQWQNPLSDKIKFFVEQDRLDFAIFDAEKDTHLHLQQQNKNLSPQSLALPPVVIANYVFSSLRQDLFFLDKDRTYEGWLALHHSEQIDEAEKEFTADHPFENVQLDYQKRRITTPDYANPQWNSLIDSYTKRLPPCALLFPAYALGALERLGNLHDGKLLLLSADRSSHELKGLATQQEPNIAFHSSFSLPVNYHALTHLAQQQGGQSWITVQDDFALFAACWQPAKRGTQPAQPLQPNNHLWRETGLAAKQALQQSSPNDFYRIKQTLETEAQYLSPEQMLAFLRLSQWDTKVFYLMFAYIFDDLAQLPAQQQNEWYVGLAEVWRYHLPIGEDYDLAYDLAMLAAELNRWPSAIYLFLQSLEHSRHQHQQKQQPEQNQSSVFFNLGIAHWQMAAHSKAESYLVRALNLANEPQTTTEEDFIESAQTSIQIETDNLNENEDDFEDDDEDLDEDIEEDEDQNNASLQAPTISEQLTELRAWQAQCQKILGAQTLQPTTSANSKALYASLLGSHQAQALYRLQRDPKLAELAGVECLQSTEHAREWIQREQTEHKHILAILHPEFGLIGVAALECPAQALAPEGSRSGRFYYWIGEEFQWQGYGTQAMKLLHQLASKIGVLHIFSTVDQANVASQRALAKLGYQRLPFDLTGERPGYRFHHFGQTASEAELYPMLAQLLAELASPTALAPLALALEEQS